jgi:ATP-dependent DNA ligase
MEALRSLRARSAIIDGEAVYVEPDGMTDFAKLHSRGYDDRIVLYAFDLLELNGEDYRQYPLEKRKARLEKLLGPSQGMHFIEHLEGDGPIIFQHACKLKLEGIVSKRRDMPYRSGPSKAWLKIKNPASPAMLRVQEEGSW